LKADIDKLRFVRIIDPVHIPRHLVEQVRDRDFTVDRFYDYQRSVCVDVVDGAIKPNPYNLLFVVVDEGNKVQGFMWAVVDALCNYLCINTFSMEKEYWFGGEAVRLLERKGKEIMEGAKLSKVYWITNCPKTVERYGFKRSKNILFEYASHKKDDENVSLCDVSSDQDKRRVFSAEKSEKEGGKLL
jgi:hypothetical protein